MQKDRELIERIAKALFEEVQACEPHHAASLWEALPDEHDRYVDKRYYRERAERVAYPDV
ncbi:hypothetical protein [Devosia chinhatensis]|uniref:Uncharacterized protein n=1 Tax=Devosia chinhatensis TaxID=429727 RepID=A0A0F5FL57_9HYPH|nr:hypothetical protein [Devosia chinhatensis]KKB09518.1 hypothetical protein VE26_06325 [Devosia chinhatensis]